MANIGTAPVEPDDQTDIKELVKSAKIQKRWVQEIKFYERKADAWEAKGKKILRRYKDERSPREQNVPRFNILWSNVQTLKPALFARNPKPDIERRFRDKDILGRISSQVLERSITYFVNEQYDAAMSQAVMDRLLPGRGTVWARYEPHFKDIEYNENEEVADEGLEITDDVESYQSGPVPDDKGDQGNSGDDSEYSEPGEEVSGEVLCWDYVHWQDFGHTFGRTWEEVDAGWRKVYLTRDELIERFGDEIGKKIKLDYSPHDLKDDKLEEIEKKATIYEIWCKSDKKVYWIHKDYQTGPLDMKDDPLELEGFFPFPRPLYATLANDTCIPVSDYQEYQDQANELDTLTSRIGAITKAIKVAGVYDASAEGIERLLAEGIENQLVPVKQYSALSEKGGLKGVMGFLPMQEILQTLLGLYEARDKVKQDLYEITGIADVIRGASDPDETYGAQRIKSQFGTLRLSSSQDDVQRFARDLIRIGTQIVAEHFSLDTIKKISGVQLLTQQEKQFIQMSQSPMMGHNGGPPMQPGMPQAAPQPMPLPPQLASIDPEDLAEMMEEPTWEEVHALLHDELMLSYKIDIETDSTIKFDQDSEKQDRIEFVTAVAKFLQEAVAAPPQMQPMLAKMLMFMVRGFKVGKELESAIEVFIAKTEKEAQNPQQKPDPEMAKVQGQMQLQQQKQQDDKELKIMQMQIDKEKAEADTQSEIARLQEQAKVDTNQANLDAQLAREKAQQDDARELAIAKMNNEAKIVVAQIGAKAQLEAASISKTTDEDGGTSLDAEGNAVHQPSMADLMQTVTTQLQQTLAATTQNMVQSHQAVANSHQALAQAMAKPKQVIRDPQTGSIVGLQ